MSLECESCGDSHTDWQKTGTAAIGGPDDHHSGLADVVKCGKCGNKQRVNFRR